MLAPHGVRPAGALPIGWWHAGDRATADPFPAVWDEPAAVLELINTHCWEMMIRLVAGLGDRLNEIHGTDHPPIYWRTLLAPWLHLVVSIVFDRRLACLAGHAWAPDAPFLTCRPRSPSITAWAWQTGLAEPHGHHDLLSRIVNAMDLPTRSVSCDSDCRDMSSDFKPTQPTQPSLRIDLPRLKLKMTSVLVGGRRGRRVQLIDVVSPSQALALYLRVRGCRPALRARALHGDRAVTPPPRIDDDRRERLLSIPTSSATESLLVRLLPGLIPVSLVEGYHHTVRESQRIYGPPTNTVIGMYGADEVQNEYLARCLVKGRRVAFAQHGGAYGQLKVLGGIRLETWPETEFVSWGWKAPGVTALPSARLSRIRDRHRGGDGVPIIEGAPPDQSIAHKGFSSVHLREATEGPRRLAKFVESLGEDPVSSRLIFKGYPSIDHSNTAVDLMRRARLAVITYFDTPFHEALALNVPVIAFWDPSIYALTEDASERLAEFTRVGVLYADPVEAAKAVRSVYARADSWWGQAAIQEARLAFLDRYGLSRDWSAAWMSYLRSFRE
jgi:putative transferase (TIGR04331 family)